MKDAMRFGQYIRWSAALLFILPVVIQPLRAEDNPISSYRTTASEVRLTFFATDGANRPVSTITKDDFAIVDGDTVVRKFRSLTRMEQSSLNITIMIDTSESVAVRLPSMVREVLDLLQLSGIHPNYSASVIAFSGAQTIVLCDRDCRSREATQALLSLKPAGATPLFDAVAFGADFISRRSVPESRPVLILLSDGGDSVSKASLGDALQSVIAAGALLYAIDVEQGNGKRIDSKQAPYDSDGSATLRRMAEATGGLYFAEDETAAGVLQAVFDDLRNSFLVTYQTPETPPGLRSLRILPKHDLKLRFHCRSSYYYGSSAP